MEYLETIKQVVLKSDTANQIKMSGRFERCGLAPEKWFKQIKHLDVLKNDKKVGMATNFVQSDSGDIWATIHINPRITSSIFQLGFLYYGGLAILAYESKKVGIQ